MRTSRVGRVVLSGIVLCALFGTPLGFLIGAASPARALGSAPRPEAWRFEVTPYIWGSGMTGDVGIGDLQSQGVEASFSDITSVLDAGAMLTIQGRKDRWGFLVDAIYMDLRDSTPTPRQQVFGDVDVGMTQQAYMAGGTWRVTDGKAPVDLVVGARWNSLRGDLELTSGIAQGRRAHAGVDWWDGLVGARVAWAFADHWDLAGYGEVGGGGSKFAWQAIAGVDWNFSKHLSGRFGYRYISLDYESDRLLYDMDMAGPYAGLGIRF